MISLDGLYRTFSDIIEHSNAFDDVFVLYAYAEPGSEANALMLFSWPLTMKSLVRPDAMMY